MGIAKVMLKAYFTPLFKDIIDLISKYSSNIRLVFNYEMVPFTCHEF